MQLSGDYEKSPVFNKKSPKFCQKSRIFHQKSPVSYEQGPAFYEKSPVCCEKIPVGSFKLYVSFTEYRLFYRALLQKRPIIFRARIVFNRKKPGFCQMCATRAIERALAIVMRRLGKRKSSFHTPGGSHGGSTASFRRM